MAAPHSNLSRVIDNLVDRRLALDKIVNFFSNVNHDRNGQNDQYHEEKCPQEFENDVPIDLIEHAVAKNRNSTLISAFNTKNVPRLLLFFPFSPNQAI